MNHQHWKPEYFPKCSLLKLLKQRRLLWAGGVSSPLGRFFLVVYWASDLGQRNTIKNNSVKRKSLWPVGFLLDVATTIYSQTAAFSCYSYLTNPYLSYGMPLLLYITPLNQEYFPLQAHIHLTSASHMVFQTWANDQGWHDDFSAFSCQQVYVCP